MLLGNGRFIFCWCSCTRCSDCIAYDYVRPSDMMIQPLGIEETKGLIIPLFFLVSINLLFNNWAKDQVRSPNV